MAAGTADGKVALFDLRSSRPVVVKDHMYGTAITSIAFHSVVGGLAGSGEDLVVVEREGPTVPHKHLQQLPVEDNRGNAALHGTAPSFAGTSRANSPQAHSDIAGGMLTWLARGMSIVRGRWGADMRSTSPLGLGHHSVQHLKVGCRGLACGSRWL